MKILFFCPVGSNLSSIAGLFVSIIYREALLSVSCERQIKVTISNVLRLRLDLVDITSNRDLISWWFHLIFSDD